MAAGEREQDEVLGDSQILQGWLRCRLRSQERRRCARAPEAALDDGATGTASSSSTAATAGGAAAVDRLCEGEDLEVEWEKRWCAVSYDGFRVARHDGAQASDQVLLDIRFETSRPRFVPPAELDASEAERLADDRPLVFALIDCDANAEDARLGYFKAEDEDSFRAWEIAWSGLADAEDGILDEAEEDDEEGTRDEVEHNYIDDFSDYDDEDEERRNPSNHSIEQLDWTFGAGAVESQAKDVADDDHPLVSLGDDEGVVYGEDELAEAEAEEYVEEEFEEFQPQAHPVEIDDMSDYEDDEHARRSSIHDLHDIDWSALRARRPESEGSEVSEEEPDSEVDPGDAVDDVARARPSKCDDKEAGSASTTDSPGNSDLWFTDETW
eukprot:TRINITY_DN123316_c0_g1_i1.p1 TRINITY_DN123316_c0_g1~~TRINITY_DN123316_c0_g1_i1.p1  ORF type:complete len:383 (-),score=101.36 TRINITY_DN123316_c0_g1_i1:46-1194(-)